MKIRSGFISNSSSSSFVVYGINDVNTINMVFSKLGIKDSEGLPLRIEDYEFDKDVYEFLESKFNLHIYYDDYHSHYFLGDYIMGQEEYDYSEFENNLEDAKKTFSELSQKLNINFDYKMVMINIPY